MTVTKATNVYAAKRAIRDALQTAAADPMNDLHGIAINYGKPANFSRDDIWVGPGQFKQDKATAEYTLTVETANIALFFRTMSGGDRTEEENEERLEDLSASAAIALAANLSLLGFHSWQWPADGRTTSSSGNDQVISTLVIGVQVQSMLEG